MKLCIPSHSAALVAFIALIAACLGLPEMALAGPDLSTPKKAAISFTRAIEAGDMEGMKAASIGSEDEYQTLKSLSEMIGSLKHMQAALIKRYGNDARQIPDLSTMMSGQMIKAQEKIDGNSAVLTVKPNDKYPPTLKKIGDEWKMEVKSMSADPDFAKWKEKTTKIVPLLDEFTRDVDAGKYPTFEQAAKALEHVMQSIQ